MVSDRFQSFDDLFFGISGKCISKHFISDEFKIKRQDIWSIPVRVAHQDLFVEIYIIHITGEDLVRVENNLDTSYIERSDIGTIIELAEDLVG